MGLRIMIVDDEAAIRESLAEALADDVADVQTAANAKQALELLAHAVPDVVLTDVRMPEMDGLALLREIRRRTPHVDVVLMTAFDDMPIVAVGDARGRGRFSGEAARPSCASTCAFPRVRGSANQERSRGAARRREAGPAVRWTRSADYRHLQDGRTGRRAGARTC